MFNEKMLVHGNLEDPVKRKMFKHTHTVTFRERIRPEEDIRLGSCTQKCCPREPQLGEAREEEAGDSVGRFLQSGLTEPPEEAGYKLYRARHCRRHRLNTI